jgi:hypothetical protein
VTLVVGTYCLGILDWRYLFGLPHLLPAWCSEKGS